MDAKANDAAGAPVPPRHEQRDQRRDSDGQNLRQDQRQDQRQDHRDGQLVADADVPTIHVEAASASAPTSSSRFGVLRRGMRTLRSSLRIPAWFPRVRPSSVVLSLLGAGSIFGAASGSWWYSCGFDGCPTVTQLRAWQPTEGGMLLDRSGAILAALSPVKRINVPITRVPAPVQAAFIAVEDRRFRTHHGIDWYGVARAAVMNVRALGVREGASTITMQLARNVFLSHRAAERSFSRKLLEVRYATLLESALTKDEILERYLNAIYLGNGVYGVEGASRDLFGKSVRGLTLAEAALLAGLPKAPSGYSPRRDLARATMRRAVVLTVLEREHVATPSAIAQARATPILVPRAEWAPRVVDSWAVEVVRVTLDSLRKIGIIPAVLNDGQLRVRSSFDKRAQAAAERAIAAGAVQVDNQQDEWSATRLRSQGALVALDPRTGAIVALVGGRRVERRGFNRASRAHRQPGSAFKPFVYAAALMRGFTSATMVEDEPIEIGFGRDTWTPANFDDSYAGTITVQDALARSSNAATVRISRDVGISRIAALARAQGITSNLPMVPALALGAGAVTPLELTVAYAPFGNGGMRITPYAVERVEDVFGRVLWQRPVVDAVRVLSDVDAFLVTSLMRGVVDDGTGRAVRTAGVRGPVAGKTGTTNDGADVWFVGYTPTIVASVWFGADEPRPLGSVASGGRLAAPVWARFIKDGWHSPERDAAWRPPAGVVSRQIDLASGMLAAEWCGESRRAWFRAGTAPTETCENDNGFDWREAVNAIELPELPSIPTPPRPPRNARRAGDRDLTDAFNAVIGAIARGDGAKAISRRVLSELKKANEERERMQRRIADRQRQLQRDAQREAQRIAERNGRTY